LITNPDGSYRKQKPWSDEWILERAKIRGEKEEKNDEMLGHPEIRARAGLRSASRPAATLAQRERACHNLTVICAAMIQLQTESDSHLKHVKGDEMLRKRTIFNEVDVTQGKTLGERGAGAEKRGAAKRGIRWCAVIDDGGEGGSNKKRAVESSLAVMTNGLQQGDEQHVAGSKRRLATKPASGRADPDPATRNASGVDHGNVGNVGGSTHLRSTSPSQDTCPSSTPSPNISGEFGCWQSDLPAPPPQPPVRARHHAAQPGHDENTYTITREWHDAAQEGVCPFEKRGVVAPARPSKEARVLAGPQQPLTVRNGAAAAAANRGGGGKGGAERREESVGIESVPSCDDDELGFERSAGRCSSMMVAPDVEVLPPREARSSTPGGQSRGAVEWGAEESWRGRGLSHVEQRGLMGMSSATSEGGVMQAVGLMEGDENHEMSWLDAAEDDPMRGGVRWAHARPRAVMRLPPPPPEPDSTPPRAKAPSSRLF
jgi:hypothetical protein